jgi:hypothetical protein
MGVSRRALLGYSGSAAAGAVLASGGSAQAEESSTVAEQAAADSTVTFVSDIGFTGASVPDVDADALRVHFTVEGGGSSPTTEAVTALDIANAINDLVTSRGWPPIRFHGHVRTALN